MTMKSLIQLTDDTDMAGWIPTEAWADLILESSICETVLSGKITAVDSDIAAGNGHTVRVRTFPARTAQGPFTQACSCLSQCSSPLQYADVTIAQYGDYDHLCDFALWQAKGPVKEGILNEMAKGLGLARDTRLIRAMGATAAGVLHTYRAETAVSWTSTATITGGCCDFRFNLYNSIVSVMSRMRGVCLKPDTIVISPELASWFYIGDRGGDHGLHVGFDAQDRLLTVAGLNVIETGTMAAPGTTGSKPTYCFIIDSSRALAEAWGKRPTFSEQYNLQCNYWEEVVWMYWGAAVVTEPAIGAVYGPM